MWLEYHHQNEIVYYPFDADLEMLNSGSLVIHSTFIALVARQFHKYIQRIPTLRLFTRLCARLIQVLSDYLSRHIARLLQPEALNHFFLPNPTVFKPGVNDGNHCSGHHSHQQTGRQYLAANTIGLPICATATA